MNHAIVRIFDVFDHAQSARDALLAEGFEADRITMDNLNDGSGAVKGNFTVGNSPNQGDHHIYERNYAKSEELSQCIVTVDTADDQTAARADIILARFGARDPDPAARFGVE
jgi:hypothetical protein